MHKSQILMYLLAAFLVGVFLASFFKVPETVELVLIIIATIIVALSSYAKTFGQTSEGIRKRKIGFLAGFLILTFTLGIVRFNKFDSDKAALKEFADRQAKQEDVKVDMFGYVDGETIVSGTKAHFPFRIKYIVIADRIVIADETTLVYTDAFPRYGVGVKLRLNGGIRTPQNFDTFDYVTYLKKEGIRTLVLYPGIKPFDKLELSVWERVKTGFYRNIFSLKNKFENALEKSLSEPGASYISGILLGSRQNIPDDLKEAFNRTGTTHILAISGYNIAIIAHYLLLILTVWFRRRKAFWISVGLIIIFTILTGASASVVRAAVMGLIMLFAMGYGRLYDVRNAILLAAALMVVANPFVLVFDIGFQLSFLAVLGLVYIYPRLSEKLNELPNPGNIKDTLFMTLSAQIAVAPLILFYFKQFSLVALPVNLLVLPFVPAAMLLGFLTGIGGMIFGALGQAIGYSAWAISSYQIGVIEFFSSIPFASVVF